MWGPDDRVGARPDRHDVLSIDCEPGSRLERLRPLLVSELFLERSGGSISPARPAARPRSCPPRDLACSLGALQRHCLERRPVGKLGRRHAWGITEIDVVAFGKRRTHPRLDDKAVAGSDLRNLGLEVCAEAPAGHLAAQQLRERAGLRAPKAFEQDPGKQAPISCSASPGCPWARASCSATCGPAGTCSSSGSSPPAPGASPRSAFPRSRGCPTRSPAKSKAFQSEAGAKRGAKFGSCRLLCKRRARVCGPFAVAGAGFEPATSGLRPADPGQLGTDWLV
jgi:hypothetical protein